MKTPFLPYLEQALLLRTFCGTFQNGVAASVMLCMVLRVSLAFMEELCESKVWKCAKIKHLVSSGERCCPEGLWLSGRKQGAHRGGEMCHCFGDRLEKRRENAEDTWEWGWVLLGHLCMGRSVLLSIVLSMLKLGGLVAWSPLAFRVKWIR